MEFQSVFVRRGPEAVQVFLWIRFVILWSRQWLCCFGRWCWKGVTLVWWVVALWSSKAECTQHIIGSCILNDPLAIWMWHSWCLVACCCHNGSAHLNWFAVRYTYQPPEPIKIICQVHLIGQIHQPTSASCTSMFVMHSFQWQSWAWTQSFTRRIVSSQHQVFRTPRQHTFLQALARLQPQVSGSGRVVKLQWRLCGHGIGFECWYEEICGVTYLSQICKGDDHPTRAQLMLLNKKRLR